MKHKFILTLLAVLFANLVQGQVMVYSTTGFIASYTMPEHGFLPGKKFKYYPTIDKYDFKGHKLRVELFDDRDSLRYNKVYCSDIYFTNTFEFVTPNYIEKVGKYIDTLFKQSNIIIDEKSTDTLQVRLEAFEVRLTGFFVVRVHGLCQMKIKYHNKIKTYCVDISDKDKHSPVSSIAFKTLTNAIRIMASASTREIIEQFLIDFKSY